MVIVNTISKCPADFVTSVVLSCRVLVSFFVSLKSLRTFQLIGEKTDTFTLDDISSGRVSYHHTEGEVGLRILQDTVNLSISDTKNGEVFAEGRLYTGLSLNVEISPKNTQPPQIHGPLFMEVKESGKAVLKINVTDLDTEPRDIVCNVTERSQFGFVENIAPAEGSEIERPGVPAQSFLVSDMLLGKVNYVQSKHKKIEPDMDSFSIRCFDGNNTSSEIKVHVSISPVNDETPLLFVQKQIVCIEDNLVIFDLSKINPYDRDRPADRLTFTVTKQPENGRLLLQKITELTPVQDFGLEVLSGNTDQTLIYQHKGTETTSDQFELSVTDGRHTVRRSVNMTIIPMDDEQPRLVVNTGLRIDRGQSKTITTRNLRAQDLDSKDSQLVFVIMVEPVAGKIQKINTSNLYTDLKKGSNFTQDDIDRKMIRCVC